jgi:hypothetical protein
MRTRGWCRPIVAAVSGSEGRLRIGQAALSAVWSLARQGKPPELPPQLPEALQIDVETLAIEKVRRSARRLGPRGSAGCSGTTYEHIIAGLRTSDRCMALSVQLNNLILGGTLPRFDSLLDSRLIALSKLHPDGQQEVVSPNTVQNNRFREISVVSLFSAKNGQYIGPKIVSLRLPAQ